MMLGSIPALAQINGNGLPGQDGGPIVVGERPEFENFRLFNFRAGLELQTRWHAQEERPADGERRRSQELEFRESIDIATQAFVLHPNFLELDLFGRFGAIQTRTSGLELDPALERGSRWDLDFLLEHNATGVFFQQTRTPLTLHTSRSQNLLIRPFGETLTQVVTEHGARLSFRSVPVPTELAYIRREQETSNRRGDLDFRLEQDSFLWESHYKPADNQLLTWHYTYDNVEQTSLQRRTIAFERHNALLGHNIDFGKDRQNNLRSSISLFHETGDLELTRLRLSEGLRLRHTPRFETRYDYIFDYTDRPGTEQVIHRGSAGFRHRLFESLTSVGTIGASRLTLSNGREFTSEQIFGDLALNYTKNVPYGRFSANTGINFNRQEDSERNGAIQVIQEPHVFSPTGIVVLQRRNIIPESIVIMDAAGIFTYTPGLDYSVQVFTDRVEIRRILGGDIQDGDLVLIDYQLEVEPPNVTTTLGWRIGARYDINEGWFKGLGVYTRYSEQDQTRRNDVDVLLPAQDVRDLVVGADYTRGYLTLLAERQWHDSTLSPFRSTRVEGRWAHPLERGSSILLTGAYQDIDRYEDDVRTQILTLSGRYNQQISDQLRIGIELLFRDERDSPGIHIQGFEQQFDFSWRYRQTSFYGMLRNANLWSDVRDSNFQTIQLGVRRQF
jgi:hypothetical protein